MTVYSAPRHADHEASSARATTRTLGSVLAISIGLLGSPSSSSAGTVGVVAAGNTATTVTTSTVTSSTAQASTAPAAAAPATSAPAATVVKIPGPAAPPATATVAQIVSCAEARHSHNTSTVSGYSVRINSQRQGYTMEGKLEENYKISKTVQVSPTSRQETFEKGEKNGQPADMNDFWLEKLGLSKKYNPEAMNLFTSQNHGRYDYSLRGTEQVGGKPTWKLAFRVKEAGSQELQNGHVWIDQSSCGVVRAEGTFPKVWVTENVTADLALMEVQPGLWLPKKQVVELHVSMPLLKRKAKMIDEYSSYSVKARK